jgi:ankyrin repeat protein
VYRKDLRELDRLLHGGVDVNLTDDDGRSVLIHAVLAEDADLQTIAFLLNHGVDLNLPDREGWTALHFAARDCSVPIVEELLARGAEVDALDAFGNTPLWRAVMSRAQPAPDVVKALLAHGADPRRRNKRGNSPLDVATKAGLTGLLPFLLAKRGGAR